MTRHKPTGSPRALRCVATGVEIAREQAFVLDTIRVRDRIQQLRDDIRTLDHLLQQFQPTAGDGAMGECRLHIPVASPAVASALGCWVAEGAFVRWREMRDRRRLRLARRMRSHPVYGAELRALDGDQLAEASELGLKIVRKVGGGEMLPQGLRLALRWGVAPRLLGRTPREALAILCGHATSGQLERLGVPPEDVEELRDRLLGHQKFRAWVSYALVAERPSDATESAEVTGAPPGVASPAPAREVDESGPPSE